MSGEICFPRGGTEKQSKRTVFDEDGEVTANTETNKKVKSKPHVVGKVGKAKQFTKKVQPSKTAKSKKVKAVTEAIKKVCEDNEVSFVPERLSTKKVVKGTLLLAAVKDIRDYELRVNLPNNLIGSVSITNMSDGYTGLLKRFAQSTEEEMHSEELCSLSELFTVGQVIPCICTEEATDSQLMQLSINPKLLHENLQPQNLRKNFVLYGCVSGVEDHGCQIDIGVSNIAAFMPTTSKTDLAVGMVRRFRVTSSDIMGLMSGDVRTVSVALQSENDKHEHLNEKDMTFNSMLPGMLLNGIVHTRKTEGLVVQLGSLKAYVHVTHLNQHVKDYIPKDKVKVRVLAVNTSTKYIHLTALPSLVTAIDSPGSGPVSIPLGEPVNTILIRIVDKYAFMKSEDGHITYMGISLLPEKLRNSPKVADTKLKSFWFGWDYLEQRPIFSTVQPNVKKSVLPTLVPGDDIDAKIVRLSADGGAKVLLASGLHAFVQNIHLTEVPLKNPEKKLKIGQKLHCKILSVNLLTKRVRLTAKPSLVNSSLDVLSDLSLAKPGSLVQGVIVKLTTGALVAFYNDVVGFVSSVNLAKEPIDTPSDVFYIGQSVTCRVLSCDAQKNKLALSFILHGDSQGTSSQNASKRKLAGEEEKEVDTKRKKAEVQPPEGPKLTVGQVIANWSIMSVTDNTFSVVSGDGHHATLPRTELSDMPGISDIIASSLTAGSVLKDLVCITDNTSSYIVSNKLMFKYYAAKDGLARDWQNVKVGGKYPGSVLSHTSHGIFISFGNGIVGLTPKRMLPAGCKSYLLPGRSVLCRVVSMDTVKERVIVAVKPIECTLPDTDSDLLYRMLAQNLSDLSNHQLWAATNPDKAPAAAKVSKYSVGEIIKGEITEREESLVKLEVEEGVVAEADGDLMSGCSGCIGNVVRAIVVHVDLINGKLAVLLDKHYISDRKSCKAQSASTKVKVGQQMKSEVVYTRPEYMLTILKGHANGRIAYVPTLQHPNGTYSTKGVFYGQENKVTVKQCDEENKHIIAALQTARDKQQSKAEQIQDATDLPATGSVVDAIITSKQALQLNLKLKPKGIGRLFVSEVEENPTDGQNPLSRFKEGQTIKVKVIGARMISTTAKLRSIKDSGHRVMLDCSLRQCNAANWKPTVDELMVGKRYTCFVTEHDFKKNKKSMNVVTSGGRQAVISWFDLGEEPVESADELTAKYPVGICLHTQLKTIGQNGTAYMKVLRDYISAGDNTSTGDSTTSNPNTCTGMVVEYKPESGLILNTAMGAKSRVPLSEMAEPGVDIDLRRFQKGLVVNCRLIKKSRHSGPLMTLRKEKGLLQKEQLEEGMVLPAFVSQLLPASASVMAAGHIVEVDMQKRQHKEFTKTHQNGSACWIRISSGTVFSPTMAKETWKHCRAIPATAFSSVNTYNIQDKAIKAELCENNEEITASLSTKKSKAQPVPPKGSATNSLSRERKEGLKRTAEEGPTISQKKSKKGGTASAEGEEGPTKAKSTTRSCRSASDSISSSNVAGTLDKETGVNLLFKVKQSKPESNRPTFDFGASIFSLRREPAKQEEGDAGCQLDNLESAGKQLKSGDLEQLHGAKARKVELAVSQTSASANLPTSEGEYLSILKKSPNNSSVWAKLIQFSCEHKGVEAGRARAEQALETVSYRLEKEKMAVWSAFLRLEMHYGTEDSFDNVKRRALQQMDELKVYQELVKLYSKMENLEEAEQCYRMMLRKWSDRSQVWMEYGQFLFTNLKLESARTLLQRCLKTLPTKLHIEVIMKFAQLELSSGSIDRFTSLFENIITNFPKRTDVWSVYIDQLTKADHYDSARNVLRRAVMQKWNMKKIQFFISKFRDFETQHGTEESLAETNQLLESLV